MVFRYYFVVFVVPRMNVSLLVRYMLSSVFPWLVGLIVDLLCELLGHKVLIILTVCVFPVFHPRYFFFLSFFSRGRIENALRKK